VTAVAAEPSSDLPRWLVAGTVVVLAHGALAAALLQWREPVEPVEVVGAIVVELAPEFIAAPEQVQSEAVPEKKIEKVEKEQEEKAATADEEKVEQKLEPQPVEQLPREAVPVTTPAPAEPPKVAALPAGPVEGPKSSLADVKAMQTWIGKISAAIERKKRYPAAALARREQGVAQVSFTLDRQGRVTDSRIVRSSGADDLDREALALLARAQPFPPWPARDGGPEHMSLTVPIRFSLK
jgi:protein TonB